MPANPLLLEAALFSYDTFFSQAAYSGTTTLPKLPSGNAIERGWTAFALPGAPGGVQSIDLSNFTEGTPLQGATITSAAHFYRGELEGKDTLVIAFRSTDEGAPEYAFQGAELPPNPFDAEFGWDLYYGLHAPVVAQALGFAANPVNGVEQVLITGHSLGGVIAELTAARLIAAPNSPLGPAAGALADRTITVTFGSPGSTADAEELKVFNLYHTDDFIARLPDLSPLFQQGGAAREGVELAVSRPEGLLQDFAPSDLDTPEEVFAATQNPQNRVEHASQLYIDSAQVLTENEHVVPGVADAEDDPFRWLLSEIDTATLGSEADDEIVGSRSSDLEFGRGGDDILVALGGTDGLAGGDDDDVLIGGTDGDRMDGGPGDDTLLAGRGEDILFVSAGTDLLNGGQQTDTAIFEGQFDEFDVAVAQNALIAEKQEEDSTTTLRQVELLQFEDATYRFEQGELVLVEPDEALALSDPSINEVSPSDPFVEIA